MAISRIKIDPQRIELQGDMAGSVRAVDHRHNSGCPGALADLLNRKDQRGGRGDMADEDDAGARCHAAPECFDHLLIACKREWNGLIDIVDSVLPAEEAPGA